MKSKKRKKFFICTTVPISLSFFKGQVQLWSREFDVCAISSNRERLRVFSEREGIRYKFLPMKRDISIVSDAICLMKFIYLFLREKPLIVHGNTPKASLLSMLAAKITFRPIRIYMCHGLRFQGAKGLKRKLLKSLEMVSCKCATNVICVSYGVKQTLITNNICNSQKAVVVGYGSVSGVDTDYFTADYTNSIIRLRFQIENNHFVFIFIGRIVADKGINELIHAFIKLSYLKRNVHLILVGEEENDLDPIAEDTKSLIKSEPNIYSVGFQEDIRPFLVAADALVLPSYREGFGISIIEAASMGIPAIATNVEGCNEVIIDGVNGSIVNPHSTKSLFRMMLKWVENPCWVKSMSKEARKIVRDKYDYQKVWREYFDYYKSLVNSV